MAKSERMHWRHINHCCPRCNGSGVKIYGNTATWHSGSGISGQAMTPDVCDECWGSGDSERPWTNLREVEKLAKQAHADEISLRAARLAGLKAGIERFAWWRNGVQYVGSCGTTLKQALEEIKLGD